MALAIDSQESGGTAHNNPTGSSLTWTFTNTAGNLLVVGAIVSNAAGAASITGVTYNGVAMSAGPSVTWDGGASVAGIFYLLTPATGAHSVIVTANGTSSDVLGGAISFSGADTGTPTGASSTNSDGGGTGTHATAGLITAASGNYLFGVGGWGSGSPATADQSATFALVGSGNTGGDDIEGVRALSSGSAINLGFTWTGADHWGMAAIEIRAPAGAASHTVLPDADLATTGWTVTPLFSKVNDASDATLITATLA